MLELFTFHLSYHQLFLVASVAMLTGMAKTGVQGAGMLSVPILAAVFGGQLSSGIMLPMLVLADIFGVLYYHRHASWQHLKLLLPWAFLGVVIGTIVGGYIDDKIFKSIMAITIVISVLIMIWLERAKGSDDIPHQTSFAIATGIVGGFTSMVGNLAGSVMSLYLLSIRLPKNEFIGTTAWFFMVVNWIKIPFHVFMWKTITWDTLWLDLTTLPLIILGAWLGIIIVKQLSDLWYRWFIIIMTLIAALGMFV